MSELIVLNNERSLAGQFRARRADNDLDYRLEKQYLAAYVVRNPDIAECTPDSIAESMLEGAGLGLSWHPQKAHLYPIPYNFKLPNGDYEKRLTVTVGYRGLLHQVLRAATIKSVQCEVVREGDPMFKVWTDETGAHFRHEPARKARGKTTHAYCLAHFTNGGHHFEVMDAAELAACEKAASARNKKGGMVWRGPFRSQMEIKSVIRRAWKFWPQDAEGILAQTMETVDRMEPIDFGSEPAVTITDNDVNTLHALLTDSGMPPEIADKWLERIASVNGLANIRDLPASAFDKVKGDLRGYLDSWRQQQSA